MTITALNTITGLLIGVDGTTTEQHLDRVEGSVLRQLQRLVGAEDIEALPLRDCPNKPGRAVDAWCASGHGPQPNWVATALVALISDGPGRVLHGPVVVLTSDQRTGRCHGLPAALAEGIGTAATLLGQAPRIAGQVDQALRV